ncbi:hypothetical protein [Pedobacter mendelii]|uniref:Lipoprotein n=1 Tax=Pedobacter mendelii TaxID=1908240 RepID=A0ABQ2BMJ1_9SPHI|nr:hypothetical protein [Pedobacter mendelii]GGI27833.1 hypothetical protein GCM10008119_29630 [Pedobacter mendelii]
MKFKNLLGLGIAIMCLAACKKESPIIEPPAIEKTDPLELLKDSISYIIDGKQMVQKKSKSRSNSLRNAVANVKLDSLVKQKEYTSGDKDSVMFGVGFLFEDEDRNGIEISLLKKYNKNQAQPQTNQTIFFVPKNKLDLFSVGERKFAMDFNRNNSQNGVVFELFGDNYGLQTNGYSSLAYHALLKPELQSQSKFEVTNLQKLKSGKYLLEAKFNASVYRGDGTNIKKIESGYLRLIINPENIYF